MKLPDRLIATVRDTIADHDMFSGVSLAVMGFSAGPDSVVCLDALDTILGKSVRMHLVYVNHGLRPRRALEREERLTARYAAQHRIAYDIVTVKVTRGRTGWEAAARDARYDALRQVRDRIGADRIVLGHNLNDRVETFLMHLIRGAGARGLISMPAVSGSCVRPLIDVPKADILAYARVRGLVYARDATNADVAIRRNYLRQKVIPALQRLNPDLLVTIRREIGLLRDDDEYLEARARSVYDRYVRETRQGSLRLDMPRIIRYNPAIVRRVIMRAIGEFVPDHAGFGAIHVQAVIDLAGRSSGRAAVLPKELYARNEYGAVVLGRRYRTAEPTARRLNSGQTRLPGLTLHCALRRNYDLRRRPPGTEVFDWALLSPPLVARPRRAGDSLITAAGRKKIKKLLNEHRIPIGERDRVFVIEDQQGILLVPGVARAQRALVGPATKEFWVVSYASDD